MEEGEKTCLEQHEGEFFIFNSLILIFLSELSTLVSLLCHCTIIKHAPLLKLLLFSCSQIQIAAIKILYYLV